LTQTSFALFVTFGDSDLARVGDSRLWPWGNPLGQGFQFSCAGYCTARNALCQASYDDYIQTDAAMSTGGKTRVWSVVSILDGEVVMGGFEYRDPVVPAIWPASFRSA